MESEVKVRTREDELDVNRAAPESARPRVRPRIFDHTSMAQYLSKSWSMRCSTRPILVESASRGPSGRPVG